MGRNRAYYVAKKISYGDLEKTIKGKEKELRVLNRLYFIRFLYQGYVIEEASEKLGITMPTAYEWLKRWNKAGYDGLVPNFNGGPKPKLSEEEIEILKNLLKHKDDWKLKEVRKLIKEQFGVEHSEMHVGRIVVKLKQVP
ncbi:MAG: transposase [ANME-2 cluster archaeon]|nr:transposase [ANME-2 cluster archaeon]MBC2748741.1 transposase [ANME-2 cluster archaeon]